MLDISGMFQQVMIDNQTMLENPDQNLRTRVGMCRGLSCRCAQGKQGNVGTVAAGWWATVLRCAVLCAAGFVVQVVFRFHPLAVGRSCLRPDKRVAW